MCTLLPSLVLPVCKSGQTQSGLSELTWSFQPSQFYLRLDGADGLVIYDYTVIWKEGLQFKGKGVGS